MDRDIVHDSQALDFVPDSQHPASRSPHLHSKKRKVALFGVVVSINSLMDLVADHESRVSQPHKRQKISEPFDVDGINHSRRMMRIWSSFLQNTMAAFKVLLTALDAMPMRRINGPWYIKPRTIAWFYLYIDWTPTHDPLRFKQFFRMTPNMFHQICDMVRVDMESHAPATFHCLPNRNLLVERMVAVAIRRLSIGDQMLGIGELFGLSVSTVSKVVWKFTQAFCHRARGLLFWPEGRAMEDVKAGFRDKWGFPNCTGAIDATHILIELPVGENSTAYFDWKHNLSITMQAVVDSSCRFLDVVIGMPGSIQDSRVLRNSCLYHHVVYEGRKLNGPAFVTETGYRLKEYLLGDAGYPLFNWLIVPFPRGMSEANDRFNRRHSSARMCVERSFGQLKGMWRLLSRIILRPKVERLAKTVLCCVLLHNLYIHRGEEVAAQVWNDARAHPEGYENRPRRNQEMFDGGQQAREAIVAYQL